MTVSAWTANHAYTAGDIVNPTVANGHSYRCTVGGTSDNTEPSWVGRYQTISDGSTVKWVVYTIVTPATVRAQLNLTGTTGQYADDIIGSYIISATESLELVTKRYLSNRPGFTVTYTSMLRAILPVPNLRTATTVTYANNDMTVNAGYWLLPDSAQTGVFTGIQFRALRADGAGPWWLVDPGWFDKALDNPFNPANYGGGYVFSSMPNDTTVLGDWGYEPGFEPGNVVHAVEVLSEWYTMRPPAILADSAITPAGGIVSYSQMPPEVQDFVKTYSAGPSVVSIG
jgi:hypothetical protein